MTLSRFFKTTAITLALAFVFAAATPAIAMDSICEGKVRGLSADYDPDTGSGFLALRTGPGTRYRQIGELFNGDYVEIRDRQGSWYNLYAPSLDRAGWASSRWIRDNCPW